MITPFSRRSFGALVVGSAASVLSGCGSPSTASKNPSQIGPGVAANIPPPSPMRLPFNTVFKGTDRFMSLVSQANARNWVALPIGERTAAVGNALRGTNYEHYTLEIDDHIENPSVNFYGQDCWTFYETSLAFARMLRVYAGRPSPQALLHMVELERYRNGRCTGSYLSRMHHLEEVFANNQRRGLGHNVTSSIGGVRLPQRNIREMQSAWRSYRYLRNNPGLIPQMARVEANVSSLPVYHIPEGRIAASEGGIQTGDVIAITCHDSGSYTSHVGLAQREGPYCRFMHATTRSDKGHQVVLDGRISQYITEKSDNAGIVVFRPRDVA